MSFFSIVMLKLNESWRLKALVSGSYVKVVISKKWCYWQLLQTT